MYPIVTGTLGILGWQSGWHETLAPPHDLPQPRGIPWLYLVWDCGIGDQLPHPKPRSDCLRAALPAASTQGQVQSLIPSPGAIPSSPPLPSPGALSLCLNQGRNRSTPRLPKPSHLRCHQDIVLESTNILWSVLPLLPGSQEAPLSPGRISSLCGCCCGDRWKHTRGEQGNQSPCWQC